MLLSSLGQIQDQELHKNTLFCRINEPAHLSKQANKKPTNPNTLLYTSEEFKIKLHHLSNHMNKLLKAVCLLESGDTHINRAFLSSVLLSYFQ